MLNRAVALVFLVAIPLTPVLAEGVLDRTIRGEVETVQKNNAAMRAAYAKARATLPKFLQLIDKTPAYVASMGIKLGIRAHDGRTEFFWISSVRRSNRGFVGVIDNRPNFATHVSMGEEIQFARNQIVDWTYVDTRTDKMFGNFTACALIRRETPAERKRFQEATGLQCN